MFSRLLMLPVVTAAAFDYNAAADALRTAPTIVDEFDNASIVDGVFRFWQKTDCMAIVAEPSPFNQSNGCYLNNPDAPYGLLLLPPHENEVLDEFYGFPVADGNLS